MRKHITFGGMTTSATDHESHEGDCALSVNLIHENDALRPMSLFALPLTPLASGSRLVATHHSSGFTHLITEHPTGDNTWMYLWTDVSSPIPHTLTESVTRIDSITAAGDMLCMPCDDGMRYALWLDDEQRYGILTRDDLLYDITITQDDQTLTEVTVPVTPAITRHLDQCDSVVTSRQALLGTLFEGFYEEEESYATGATMVSAQMEAAIEAAAARHGMGTHRHVSLGIAALRLYDGSHVMFSNIFALLPADITDTITVDRQAGLLRATTYLHRHTVTISLRTPNALVSRLASGIDIFLTRPTTFLDMRRALAVDTDTEGHTVSLTFGPKDSSQLLHHLDITKLHLAMTIDMQQLGEPLLLSNITAHHTTADMSDMRRLDITAALSFVHQRRVTLCGTTTLLHSPMELAVRYRYPTLDAPSRLALDETQLATALRGEWTAGHRADITDTATGAEVQLVTKAGGTWGTAWWLDTVQYPLTGMMMYPGHEVTVMEYHLRLPADGGFRYFTTRQQLRPLASKDLAVAVHTPQGQVHRTRHPAYLSLLFQQTRALAYDPLTGLYDTNYWLWQEESADDYEREAAHARRRWPLHSDAGALVTSAEGNPLVFSRQSATRLGGKIRHVVGCTRRSADTLFGDGQYYAFTDTDIWLLRLNGDKWSARQTVCRDMLAEDTIPVVTDDAVAFLSPRGVMLLKGSQASCISSDITGHPLRFSFLPQSSDIMATEPALPPSAAAYPVWTGAFLQGARMCYDAAHNRLWIYNPSTTPEGRQRYTAMLVYSFSSRRWGSIATSMTSSLRQGDDLWVTMESDEGCQLSRVSSDVHRRIPFLVCTRPLALGQRHAYKTLRRVLIRGLFHDRGTAGSHVGMAVYGSNDLYHWRLLATSVSQYFQGTTGTPMKWFRVAAIGSLLPGESIEGVTLFSHCKCDK